MNKHYPYVPAIDGLRAIAVLAVMLYHLDASWLPGGFAGVDVFFVISGYVVSRSLVGRTGESFGQFLAGFYSRRIRRIIPALIVCLLVTSLFTVLFIPESWLSSTIRQVGLYAFFGLSNLALVWYQDDYFSPRAEFNPFVHTWSLGVEEQFYFIFPALIYFWFLAHNRSHARGFRVLVNWLIPALAIVSLYTAYNMGQSRPDWAYYMLPARFWELAAGVMLFQLQAKGRLPRLSGSCASICLGVGLLTILAGYLWANVDAFPYPWALLPVIGTLLSLGAITGQTTSKAALALMLTHPAAVYCGKISYSLYLWHWPVYTLMRWTTGLETPLQMAIAVALTFLLAGCSFHFIETPVRRARTLAKPPYRGLLAGGFAIALLWAGAWQLFEHRNDLSLSVTADTRMWRAHEYPDHAPKTANSDALQGRKMFVIGNSHTGAYSTMVSLLRQRQGIEAHLIQTGHCAIGNLLYPIQELEGCQAIIDYYLNLLTERAKPGDIVFFASLRTHRLADQWVRSSPKEVLAYSQSEQAANDLQAAYAEIAPIIKVLERQGVVVLFDAPKPVLQGPAYRCSDWFNANNPVCGDQLAVSEAFIRDLRQPMMESLARIKANFSNVQVWDPLPYLCSHGECSPFDSDGLPLYFDGDHISGHGNRVLYPHFEQEILSLYNNCESCSGLAANITPLFPEPIRPGEQISFNKNGTGLQYMGPGWSLPEDWGVWSESNRVVLYIPVDDNASTIRIEARPFLASTLTGQRVQASINGKDAGTFLLTADSTPYLALDISETNRSKTNHTSTLKLELRLPDAASPTDLGVGADPRKLGIGLNGLFVE